MMHGNIFGKGPLLFWISEEHPGLSRKYLFFFEQKPEKEHLGHRHSEYSRQIGANTTNISKCWRGSFAYFL
jgi:hypothetical protein